MDDDDINDSFDFGAEPDETTIYLQLPPQLSANDTSNQDIQIITSPDGKEHIKDTGSDDIISK